MDARVLDARGMFVRDLKKEDFQVLEDGAPQTIATFALVDIPVERPLTPLFARRKAVIYISEGVDYDISSGGLPASTTSNPAMNTGGTIRNVPPSPFSNRDASRLSSRRRVAR